jgi:putative MATE family efflux protein
MLAENIIGLTDTMFLARVSETDLGASAIGGTFYVIVFIIGLSFSIGTQIIISRRLGENRPREVGEVFELGLLFLLVLAIVIYIMVHFFAGPVFKAMLSSPEVFEKTMIYLKYRMLGIFFTYIACAYRAFFTGIFKTKFLIINAIILASVNIVFAYIFIFGKLGMPAMGIKGAAIATLIAEFASVLYYVIVSLFVVEKSRYRLFYKKRYHLRIIPGIISLSGFIILQNLVSLVSWFTFFIFIEQRGPHDLAVSNIVRSLYVFFMIPGWAFSSSTGSLVSNIIGQGRRESVIPLLKKITRLCFLITLPFLIMAALFPHFLLSLYTSDASLIADCLPSFYVVMGALLAFSLSVSFYSGVTGTGNSQVTLLIELLGLLFYLLLIYYFVIYLRLPLHIAWIAEIVYFVVIFLASLLYMKTGNWRKKII